MCTVHLHFRRKKKKKVQILYESNINRNITIFEINTKEKSKVLKITEFHTSVCFLCRICRKMKYQN